jgi:hypothetical protein
MRGQQMRVREAYETRRQEVLDAAAVAMVAACEAHLEPPYDDDIGKAYIALRHALRLADVVLD